MKLKFSRIQRLLTRKDYREVYNGGQKYIGNKLLIFYRLATSPNPRLGITIKKKRGKAHERNRFKRVVREAYRAEYLKLPPNIELNIHPREGYGKLTPEEILCELKTLVTICGEAKSKPTTGCSNN